VADGDVYSNHGFTTQRTSCLCWRIELLQLLQHCDNWDDVVVAMGGWVGGWVGTMVNLMWESADLLTALRGNFQCLCRGGLQLHLSRAQREQ